MKALVQSLCDGLNLTEIWRMWYKAVKFAYHHLPSTAPLQPWVWSQRLWPRVHSDYAGPLLGRQFLILMDAHSKWIEIKSVTNPTSAATIEHLLSIFATRNVGI